MKSVLNRTLAAALLALAASLAKADTTPMEENIPEKKATSITVAFPATTTTMFGQKVALPAGEYHYQVFLPPGYHDNPKREYPCLFVSMAGGNATPGVFLERLTRDQWMAVCLTESKNGPWEPIASNFYAAHDDAVKRFRIANHFKFMTGFSGGARAASLCSGLRPGFAGLFLQGAAFADQPVGVYSLATLQTNPGLSVYAVFGIGDLNRDEAPKLNPQLPPATPRKLVLAEGDHHPATKATAEEAMDYLQDCVYARRPLKDPAAQEQYIIRFHILLERAKNEQGLAKLEILEMANRIAAARQFSADKTLTAEVADATKQAKELAAQPDLAKELQARAAYQKIRDTEDAAWIAQASQAPKLTAFTKQAAPAYEGVSKKFEDTVYGKKAAERAVWLEKGVVKPIKPSPPEK